MGLWLSTESPIAKQTARQLRTTEVSFYSHSLQSSLQDHRFLHMQSRLAPIIDKNGLVNRKPFRWKR